MEVKHCFKDRVLFFLGVYEYERDWIKVIIYRVQTINLENASQTKYMYCIYIIISMHIAHILKH